MSSGGKIIWIDGDPYTFDNEGELVEIHHSGQLQ